MKILTLFKFLKSKKILKLLNLFTCFLILIFFIFLTFVEVDHVAFKNKFSELDSMVPAGIKISAESGMTSYGMFPVGYTSDEDKFNGYESSNNIYEITEIVNRAFLEKGEVSKGWSLETYEKNNGLYLRTIPYLFYQITSIFSVNFVYVKLMYVLLAIMGFLKLFFSIQRNQSILKSYLFITLFMTNSYFITYVESFSSPFFFQFFPIIILTIDRFRNYLKEKNSLILLILVFLLPGLITNTHGPIVWLSFLTGYILFDKNFKIRNEKIFIFKSFISFSITFLLNELLWMLQSYFFLNYEIKYVLNNFINSVLKYLPFFGSDNLESCADIAFTNFLENIFYIKMNDFIFFEVYLINYLQLFLIIFFTVTIFDRENITELLRNNLPIIYSFLITFTWFLAIKGAFSCHLHVYPKYFLLSFVPILFSFKIKNFNPLKSDKKSL